MMKLKLLIPFLVFVYSTTTFGQAQASLEGGVMYINKNQKESGSLKGKRGGFYGQHILGDTITMAYDKFLKHYVYYESTGGAYASEKKIIAKRSIYNSVLKLDKHIKKLVRIKEITREEGKSRIGAVLSKAITIRFYETSQFENILSKNMKDLNKVENYYKNLVIQ